MALFGIFWYFWVPTDTFGHYLVLLSSFGIFFILFMAGKTPGWIIKMLVDGETLIIFLVAGISNINIFSLKRRII